MAKWLTPRQVEILDLARQGLTSSKIATRLHLSPATVRTQRAEILYRLQSRNITQAVYTALKLGYLKVKEVRMEKKAKIPRIQLTGEEIRQFGVPCLDCGSRKTVYFISFALGTVFPPGAYCYKCLLKRCRLSRMIPVPIQADLMDKLKLDMGLKINTPPKGVIWK